MIVMPASAQIGAMAKHPCRP